MKFKLLGIAILACSCIQAQTTNTVTTNAVVKKPEGIPLEIAWDHQTEDEECVYKLYSGTNLIRTFVRAGFTNLTVTLPSTNFTILGKTGQVTYFKGFSPPLPKGSNWLTLAAENVVSYQSDPSNIQPVKALGKPLPTSEPRL